MSSLWEAAAVHCSWTLYFSLVFGVSRRLFILVSSLDVYPAVNTAGGVALLAREESFRVGYGTFGLSFLMVLS